MSTIKFLYVEAETVGELEDLVSALRGAWSTPRFPNLRTAQFCIIHSNRSSTQSLLNALSSISHAYLCVY